MIITSLFKVKKMDAFWVKTRYFWRIQKILVCDTNNYPFFLQKRPFLFENTNLTERNTQAFQFTADYSFFIYYLRINFIRDCP